MKRRVILNLNPDYTVPFYYDSKSQHPFFSVISKFQLSTDAYNSGDMTLCPTRFMACIQSVNFNGQKAIRVTITAIAHLFKDRHVHRYTQYSKLTSPVDMHNHANTQNEVSIRQRVLFRLLSKPSDPDLPEASVETLY